VARLGEELASKDLWSLAHKTLTLADARPLPEYRAR